MIRLILTISILTICTAVKSQTKALTEDGKEVMLLDNGTWKYSNDSIANSELKTDSLTVNNSKFAKSNKATFLVKSKVFNVGIYMDPAKWTFASHRDNEVNPEYRFNMKQGDGYAIIITEKTTIALENMREIALLNAQKASVDVRETSAEYRIVNGLRVLRLTFQATVKGMKITYLAYYFSNNNGTVQLLSFTTQDLFSKNQKELETFLNGLVEISS